MLGHPFQPLHLIRNVRILPDICNPTTAFVVSERVRDEIVALCGICQFAPVHFDKLVDFPILPIGTDYQDSAEYRQLMKNCALEEVFDYLPDVSSEYSIGRYYEIVEPVLASVNKNYPGLKKYTVQSTTSWVKEVLWLSSEFVNDFPVFFWSANFFADRVFKLIDPYLNRTFYEVIELEVE